MKRIPMLIAVLFAGLQFSPALAQEATEPMAYDLVALDTDGSGGVSIEELLVANDSVTPEAFASADADASGELSVEELAVFSASMTMATE